MGLNEELFVFERYIKTLAHADLHEEFLSPKKRKRIIFEGARNEAVSKVARAIACRISTRFFGSTALVI